MNGTQQKRLANALRIAHAIKRLLDKDYEFIDADGHFVRDLEITDTHVWWHITGGRKILLSTDANDPHGLGKTVAEFNSLFDKWRVVAPANLNEILRLDRKEMK
jgi:hypothetical protein